MATEISKVQAGQILRSKLDKRYQRHPEYEIGEIRDLVKEDGQITGALVDIGGEIATVDAPGGRGMAFMMPGMQWRMKRPAGNVLGSPWAFDICLTNPVGNASDSPSIYLPTPIVQAAELGGFKTYQGRRSNDPGGPIQAALLIFPRATILASYSLYDWEISHLAMQVRVAGATAWGPTIVSPLMPNHGVVFALASGISDTDTSITVNLPLTGFDEVPSGVPLMWRVGGEILLGIWDGVNTITVVAHDGLANDEYGLGFVEDVAGRGRPDGETGATAHSAGTYIECMNVQTITADLSPGVPHQFRVAAMASSGRQGPWGDIVSFTSWAETTPPLAPANLLVDQLSTGIKATWSAVNQDEAGKPRADVKRYAVLRAATNLGAAFAIATYGHQMTEAQLQTAANAAPATVYDTRLQATSVLVPANVGNGNFIGVAAIDYSGNWSEWAWSQDNLAPPYPNSADVIMYEVEDGIAYKVPESASSFNSQTGTPIASPAHRDPGFKQYALMVAGDPVGTGATIAGYGGPGSAGVIPINGGVTGYYKLVAVDAAGNMNNAAAPNNHGFTTNGTWKLIFSRYPELGLPPNGNFQVPDPAGLEAKGWSLVPNGFASRTYQDTGGKEGNRVYKITTPAPGTSWVLTSSLSRVLPAGTGAAGEVWVYQTSGVTKLFGALIYFYGYATDDGTGPEGGFYAVHNTSAPVNVPSHTWTRLDLTQITDSRLPTDRSGYYRIDIRHWMTAGGADPYDVYVDAAKMKFT